MMLVLTGFVAALLLTYFVLLLAERLRLLAEPNERSSHDTPTPAVGGVAIVIPVLCLLGVLWPVLVALPRALLAAGSLLAVVSLADDIRDLGAVPRLLCQLVAVALLALYWDSPWPWWVDGAVAFAVLWLVNLYNFMDGIDGLAAVQCLTFCVGTQLLAGGFGGWSGQITWLLAGTMLGFLVYNWPRASIFMGDVGSAFLGLVLGTLVVELWLAEVLPLLSLLILLSAFWFDATWTLITRILTGQAFLQAHRSHLYQQLAARQGHLWTTLAFAIFAAVWLTPLAWLATERPGLGWLWLALAVAPLAWLAWRFGAGRRSPPAAKEGSSHF